MADIARLLRERRAAQEVEDIQKRSNLTREEAIKRAAEEYGVSEKSVAILRKQMDVPPEVTRARPATPGEAALVKRLKKEQKAKELTEKQKRVVETLRRQGREVTVKDGVITTTEDGRKVIITPRDVIATVPPSAVVSIALLEAKVKERKERERVEAIRKEREVPVKKVKREITPEELVRKVIEERKRLELEKKSFARRAITPAVEFTKSVLRGFKKSVEFAGKPIKTPQENIAFVKDPDVQIFMIASGITIAAGTFPAVAKVVTGLRRVLGAKAAAEFAVSREPEKFGEAALLLTPDVIVAIKVTKVKIPKPKVLKEIPPPIKFIELVKRPSGIFVAPTPAVAFRPPIPITPTPPIPTIPIRPLPTVLALEFGARAFIIGAVRGRELIFGVPSVAPEIATLPLGVEIKPGTPTETQILQKALQELPKDVVTVRGREAIPLARSIIMKTRTTQSRYMRDLPRATKRLDEKGVNIIRDLAKEKEAIIFGSFSRKAQLIEPGELAKDIDVRLVGATPEEIKSIQLEAIRRLQVAGFDAKAGKEASILVRQPTGEYAKAVEFRGEFGIEGEDVPPQVLGVDKFGKPITIEGQRVTALAEELRGVTQGVVRIRKVSNGIGLIDIYPPEKRIKDIPELFISAETLAKSKFVPSKKLEQDIERLRTLFPEVEDISKTEVKIMLADFSGKAKGRPIPSPISPFVVPSVVPIPPISPIPSPIPSPPISPIPSVVPSPIPSPPISPIPSPPPAIPSPPLVPSPIPSPPPVPSPIPSVISAIPSPIPSPPIIPIPSPIPSPVPSPVPSPIPSPLPSPSPVPSISPSFVGKPSPKEKRVQLQKLVPTGEQGYDVLVREGEKRGDKFKKVAEGLPKHKALKRGKRIVDNFIEASYLIKESKIEPTVPDDPRPPDLSKFRSPVPKSKLPRETLIEMVQHRIDTVGEKRQLSFFKELAKRKKQRLQTMIVAKKKQQLQSAIATQAQQVSFISSPKSNKKQKVKSIKFL